MVRGVKTGWLLALAGVLGACTGSPLSTELASSGDSLSTPPVSVRTMAQPMKGLEAPYCPQISLREGTAILKQEVAGKIEYVASITKATRDCRIVDGKLRIEVGLVGRVTAGPAGQDRALKLPIRVAVLKDGKDVVYSQLGYQAAVLSTTAGAQSFVYVDRGISLDQTAQRNLVIYAGYDEAGGR